MNVRRQIRGMNVLVVSARVGAEPPQMAESVRAGLGAISRVPGGTGCYGPRWATSVKQTMERAIGARTSCSPREPVDSSICHVCIAWETILADGALNPYESMYEIA